MTCSSQKIPQFLVKTVAYQYFNFRSICRHLLKPRCLYSSSAAPFLTKQELWSYSLHYYLVSVSHPRIRWWTAVWNYATLCSCCLWEEVWNNAINASPTRIWSLFSLSRQVTEASDRWPTHWSSGERSSQCKASCSLELTMNAHGLCHVPDPFNETSTLALRWHLRVH